MSITQKNAVLINLTGEQIANDLAEKLKPFIDERLEKALESKSEEAESPISMAEAADYFGLSRTTFSKLVSKGEIPFTSLNPDNKKAKKLFTKKALQEWLSNNKSKTVQELKDASYGKGKK